MSNAERLRNEGNIEERESVIKMNHEGVKINCFCLDSVLSYGTYEDIYMGSCTPFERSYEEMWDEL